MTDDVDKVTVSTPGRVCLFGEHQDYLNLPVIPAAISLRVSVQARKRADRRVEIDLPDISAHESFSVEGSLPYRTGRDYFRGGLNVVRRHGLTFHRGLECTVHGTIPINAGTSSSSALVVAWTNALALMSDQVLRLPPETLARYAHEAEVLEFGEPGGMMDHYSTAFGGVLFLQFQPQIIVDRLQPNLGAFVLGDSGEPKETKAILARTKKPMVEIMEQLSTIDPAFSLGDLTDESVLRWKSTLDSGRFKLLEACVQNHAITLLAKELLQRVPIDHRRLGELLNHQQAILRDVLRISTPKIDRMIESAMDAGAYGGKINGSGGGGCMFAYAPENSERVAEAIERAGGTAWIVAVDEGTRDEVMKGD